MSKQLEAIDAALANLALQVKAKRVAEDPDQPATVEDLAILAETTYGVCARLRDALPAAPYASVTSARPDVSITSDPTSVTGLMAKAFVKWANSKKGEAEDLHLRALLQERGLDTPLRADVPVRTLVREGSEPVARLADIFWHFDPAASCHRRRAFVDAPGRRFVLIAYEDGVWGVEENLQILAQGQVEDARRIPAAEDERAVWPLVGPLAQAKLAALENVLRFIPRGRSWISSSRTKSF